LAIFLEVIVAFFIKALVRTYSKNFFRDDSE